MKISYDESYRTVLREAADLARSEGEELISRRHLFQAAIQGKGKLFRALLGGATLFCAPRLPLARKASFDGPLQLSADAYRVLSLEGGVLGNIVYRLSHETVTAAHLVAALLLDSKRGPVSEALKLSGKTDVRDEVLQNLARIESSSAKQASRAAVSRKVRAIRTQLEADVVGHREAIERIALALFDFWSLPGSARTRPLKICLCGPSGCGKSVLTASLAKAVAKVSERASGTVLNASLFATENTSHDAWGYDDGWRGGARPGTVGKPVSENPNGVLALEDIDLLYPTARARILDALTKGRMKDDGLGQEVDFSQAIVVTTTSAGAAALQPGVGRVDKARLVEELCSGVSSENAVENIRAFAMNADVVIALRPPDASAMRTLVERELDRVVAGLKRLHGPVRIDKSRVADLLTRRLEALDPRCVATVVDEAVVEPVHRALVSPAESARGRGIRRIRIDASGAEPFDPAEVERSLGMRRRVKLATDASVVRGTLSLRISACGEEILPAVQDGIVRVEAPEMAGGFEKLVGLERAIDFGRKWEKYFAGETAVKPEHLLLVGPPGTGKTSFVRALAAVLKKPYAILNCQDLVSPAAINAAFSSIRRYAAMGMLVFLDELDCVAGDRDGKSEGYVERENLMLQQIDGFVKDESSSKILFVGATNRLAALDSAFMRSGRLGQTISFCLPKETDRRRLIEMEGEACGISIPSTLVAFMSSTTDCLAPSSIKGIVRDMALDGDGPLTREKYIRARQNVVHGVMTQDVEVDETDRMSVALHESAHALTAELCGCDFVQATIVPFGERLGMVEECESATGTEEGILDAMAICLAGRAAQEIAGLTLEGCASDLKRASHLALKYIRNGYSQEYGLALPESDFEWESVRPVVRRLVDERYAYVKDLLRREWRTLEALAARLYERKVVFQDEVKELCEGCRKEVSHE